jgi:hypothetical protein
MAKPYGDCSGSGMHIHASLNDGAGKNVLARPEGGPADTLLHAVAGLLAAMPETMLAFAPNYNSFRRFRPDAHAPVSASWGIDDRSAAVRVIVGDAKATRIEHRISGADVNPHVAMAAMLGAMLQGIEQGVMPRLRKTRCIRAKAHRCRWNGALPRPPLPLRRGPKRCSARASAISSWPASSRTAPRSCPDRPLRIRYLPGTAVMDMAVQMAGQGPSRCALCRHAHLVCRQRQSRARAARAPRRASRHGLRDRRGVYRPVGGAGTGRARHDVIVLESERVGWGASGRNGGQLINGYSRGLDVLEARHGPAWRAIWAKWRWKGPTSSASAWRNTALPAIWLMAGWAWR